MQTRLYFLKTVSSLHCGVGEGLADIDRPVTRHPVTGHPFVPGSSLKGVLRDDASLRKDKNLHAAVFGSEPGEEQRLRASCASFGDARLVCLPVRSLFGTFAYLASPVSLRLLQSDLTQAGWKAQFPPIPSLAQGGVYEVAASTDSALFGKVPEGNATRQLQLEEFAVTECVAKSNSAAEWSTILQGLLQNNAAFDAELFRPRFAIVCDLIFDFLCESALPVSTRNALNEDGTADDQKLWTEETVPPEAIFVGLIHAENSRRDSVSSAHALDYLEKGPRILQIGGKATTGRGIVSLSYPATP